MATPPKKPPVQGLSPADRANLRLNIGLELALDHIDAIYQQRILHVYGCGLVLGLVCDEFDKFMSLEPTANKNTSTTWLSNVLVGIFKTFSALPPFNAVVGTVATVAEGVLAVKETIVSPPASDYDEPNPSMAAYLREQSLKVPFFQQILSQRYLLEYERINKRKEFLAQLDLKLQDPAFAGTPLSLATSMFGQQPAQLTPDQVYALFLGLREKLFKALLRQYVSDNVTIFWFRKEALPGQSFVMENYLIGYGLNGPQWDMMFARFGRVPTQGQKIFLQTFTQIHNAMPFSVTGLIRAYHPIPDPALGEVADLWRLWGAKRQEWNQSWYGTSKIQPAKH